MANKSFEVKLDMKLAMQFYRLGESSAFLNLYDEFYELEEHLNILGIPMDDEIDD